MQTATSTLLAAIQRDERTPVVRAKADWLGDGSFAFDPGIFRDTFVDTFEPAGDMGDLSGWVESATVDRSLSTDLPDAAKIVSGSGAAELTITLRGNLLDSQMDVGRALSAHQGGAGTFRRIGAPITVDLGFVGDGGPEYLRQFTGKVRSLTINPNDGGVTITALDGRERMRKPVTLPVSFAVSAQTFMTAIASANGATTSFETSLNTSVATPTTDTSDPWEVLQQIAGAEQGSILFDENDVLRFYNRNHMSGGAAVATITTDPSSSFDNLVSVNSEETVDSVRNYVTVPATPMVLDPVGTVLWSLSELRGVPANSTIVFPVELPGTLSAITGLTYLAAKNSDGTGGDVSNLVLDYLPVSSTTGNLTVRNPNNFDIFLVRNSTLAPQGDPYTLVTGQVIRPASDSGYVAVRQSAPSQSLYGYQTLDVGANVWRQSAIAADGLADFLLAALQDPHPVLSGVEIVGDPRLQLADRVRVVEPDGLALDGEFWLTAINTSFGSGGLSQAVTLRRV